jgi:4-aminobutyrate aminotransferase-like enzyme
LSRTCGSNNKRTSRKNIAYKFNVVTYEPYIELCEELAEILPHGEARLLVSTGAEAVENAKSARQATETTNSSLLHGPITDVP